MLILIIIIFIFKFVSYERMKKDFFNMYIMLNKICEIKDNKEINENKNWLKINKKSKGKKRRKINNKIKKDNITKINFKENNNKIKYSNNARETTEYKKDKLSSKQNIINISNINSYDINIKKQI